jgi:hypothetical protein
MDRELVMRGLRGRRTQLRRIGVPQVGLTIDRRSARTGRRSGGGGAAPGAA